MKHTLRQVFRSPFPPAKPNWHGVVGARTTRTTGKASAAEFAAAAKEAGLHFIVFLEEFSMLPRDEFESLCAECAKLSDDTFQAYPGFTIQDVFGNHYFVCGPKTVWPEKDLLDADGKRFTDVFQGMNPKSPGTLGAVPAGILVEARRVHSGHLPPQAKPPAVLRLPGL